MATINGIEQRHIETVFQMGGGYVLDFVDRTFRDFFAEMRIDIDDAQYRNRGTSKANRLRSFLQSTNNQTAGRAITRLLEYTADMHERRGEPLPEAESRSVEKVRAVADRLLAGSPVVDLAAMEPTSPGEEMSLALDSIRASIERNTPEAGIDHLHTLMMHYTRKLCDRHGLAFEQGESLNGVFGKYVRWLEAQNRLQAPMSLTIMKTSISILEKFNAVRNDQSLAHANPVINKNEAILILSNITALIRFVRSLETL
jgi:hypothetical protein